MRNANLIIHQKPLSKPKTLTAQYSQKNEPKNITPNSQNSPTDKKTSDLDCDAGRYFRHCDVHRHDFGH